MEARDVSRITFGLQLLPLLQARTMMDVIASLDRMGFDHLTMPDHMLFPDRGPGLDAWTLLAGAAARTRRLTLGTLVSDPHRIHPAVLAQRVATLDQLSRGRAELGLGAGEVMNLDPFGIAWDKPVSRLKEAVHVIRHLLDSEEPLDFEGRFYSLRRARLQVRPYRGRRVPLGLASLGPVMQRFTGEVADAWLPVVVPAEHYNDVFAPIEAAATAAGRTVQKTAIVPLAFTRDRSLVLRVARKFVLDLIWPGMLARMGVRLEVPAELAAVHYQTVDPCDPDSVRRYQAHGRLIPDEVIEKFMTYGDAADIRRRLAAYVDAGVTRFTIINASPDPLGSTLTLATEVLPYFTRRAAPVVARVARVLAPVLPRSAEEKTAIRRLLAVDEG